MYVCVCNAVTEDDVRGCMAGGACSPKEVRAACGMKPGCGSCTKRLHALVSEYRTASDLVDAITGGPASPVMPAEHLLPGHVLPEHTAPEHTLPERTAPESITVAGPSLPVRNAEHAPRTATRAAERRSSTAA
ncbi:bacterioferritin-associated ferredoxin [Actinomadura sp. 9N407]|uniref:bacterioferritin-associated ferredoxin n=1 Tax=Actinomadura sp. 9N407 TaxID=3375154 RepID=UPI0037AF58F7